MMQKASKWLLKILTVKILSKMAKNEKSGVTGGAF